MQKSSIKKNENTNSQYCHIMNILPEANLIFESLQHAKKSIYPFQMKSKILAQMANEQKPYSSTESAIIFKPTLPSIRQHFQNKYLIYDKFNNNLDEDLFNMNIYPMLKLKNLKNQDYVINIEETASFSKTSSTGLSFDSRFQSGNLSMVSYLQETDVHYLLLHNDINTSGYTSWFYFKVKNIKKGNYKFAILNYGKAGWQHNQGVKICYNFKNQGWKRGGNNIHCQANKNIFSKGFLLNFNSLYFQFEFQEDNSEIYFAYNVPYTYNDLCSFLNELESRKSPFFHRKIAGLSLAGNRLQIVSITNFKKLSQTSLKAIVIMARAHPGQTVSSWVLHNLIKFLLSDNPQAETLRNNFIFKIIPMINPDGVIHGNYRCSLSGRDLNRRWAEPNKQLFPEVYYIKNHILEINRVRGIKLILDLHGHTQKKNFFAYGCNDRLEPHRCRLFPYIVSKFTENFTFRFCNFYIDKSKIGTARVTLFKLLKIPYIYTIEGSQFGTEFGHHCEEVFLKFAKALALGIKNLFHLKLQEGRTKQTKQKIEEEQVTNFEQQLINDAQLMKIGLEKDSGSDSEPSVDNIEFGKLKQLNERKSLKINSQIKKIIKVPPTHTSLTKFQKKNTNQIRPRTTQSVNRRKLRPENSLASEQPLVPQQVIHRTPQKQRNISQQLSYASERKKSPSFPQRKTQGVNFINLSLSINDDIKSRQKTCKLSLIPLDGRQEDQWHKRLKITSKNFHIFRKRK